MLLFFFFFPSSLTPTFLLISLSPQQFGFLEMISQRKMNQRGVITLKQFSRAPRLKMSGHKSLGNSATISLYTRIKFKIGETTDSGWLHASAVSLHCK